MMVPTNDSAGACSGTFLVLNLESNNIELCNVSASSEPPQPELPQVPVEKTTNVVVAGGTDGASIPTEKGTSGSKNRKRVSSQRDPDCVPRKRKLRKSSLSSPVRSNRKTPSDISQMPLLNTNPNPKGILSGFPPDYLVKLLKYSGWKVETEQNSGNHVYVSPSCQTYWSAAKVYEALLRSVSRHNNSYNYGLATVITDTQSGAATELKEKKLATNAKTSSPSAENMEPISLAEEPIHQVMTPSPVNSENSTSNDNAENISIDKGKCLEVESNPMAAPEENSTKQNDHDAVQSKILSTVKDKKDHMTISPATDVNCFVDKHLEIGNSSFANVSVIDIKWAGTRRRSNPKRRPMRAAVIMAESCRSSSPICALDEKTLPSLKGRSLNVEGTSLCSSSMNHNGDIIGATWSDPLKEKLVPVDDGSDKQLEAYSDNDLLNQTHQKQFDCPEINIEKQPENHGAERNVKGNLSGSSSTNENGDIIGEKRSNHFKEKIVPDNDNQFFNLNHRKQYDYQELSLQKQPEEHCAERNVKGNLLVSSSMNHNGDIIEDTSPDRLKMELVPVYVGSDTQIEGYIENELPDQTHQNKLDCQELSAERNVKGNLLVSSSMNHNGDIIRDRRPDRLKGKLVPVDIGSDTRIEGYIDNELPNQTQQNKLDCQELSIQKQPEEHSAERNVKGNLLVSSSMNHNGDIIAARRSDRLEGKYVLVDDESDIQPEGYNDNELFNQTHQEQLDRQELSIQKQSEEHYFERNVKGNMLGSSSMYHNCDIIGACRSDHIKGKLIPIDDRSDTLLEDYNYKELFDNAHRKGFDCQELSIQKQSEEHSSERTAKGNLLGSSSMYHSCDIIGAKRSNHIKGKLVPIEDGSDTLLEEYNDNELFHNTHWKQFDIQELGIQKQPEEHSSERNLKQRLGNCFNSLVDMLIEEYLEREFNNLTLGENSSHEYDQGANHFALQGASFSTAIYMKEQMTESSRGKGKALASSMTLPDIEGTCVNDEATGLDSSSLSLPSHPNTIPMHHQGDIDVARRCDLLKGIHVPLHDGSSTQLQADYDDLLLNHHSWQELVHQIINSDGEPMPMMKGLSRECLMDEETLPGLDNSCLNGKATRLDCSSFVLPSQTSTSSVIGQGDLVGSRMSDVVKGKNVLVDEGSDTQLHDHNDDSQLNKIHWQQFAFQILGSDRNAKFI